MYSRMHPSRRDSHRGIEFAVDVRARSVSQLVSKDAMCGDGAKRREHEAIGNWAPKTNRTFSLRRVVQYDYTLAFCLSVVGSLPVILNQSRTSRRVHVSREAMSVPQHST